MPRLAYLLLLLFVLPIVGCDTADEDTELKLAAALHGNWVSEGSNVAPGLASNPAFPTQRIRATFNANGTYNVVATSTNNQDVTFTGTYTTAASTNGQIRTITLNQTAPTQVTSAGIYEVVGTTLRYEVIQTAPAIQGFNAPTAAAGFGSTSFNNTALGATWIQTFVKSN